MALITLMTLISIMALITLVSHRISCVACCSAVETMGNFINKRNTSIHMHDAHSSFPVLDPAMQTLNLSMVP